MDLSIVVLAEDIGLQGQLFDIVLRPQQVVIFVPALSDIGGDPLEGLGVGPEGKFGLGQKGFFVESEEELEAGLHDGDALVD